MFQVTTVLPKPHGTIKDVPLLEREGQEKEEEKKVDAPVLSKNQQKKLAKKASKDGAKAEGDATEKATEEEKPQEETKEQVPVIPFEERKVNYKKDFFSKPAFLTVSGQLSVENFACGMGDVYTFGPTFRAENSNTTRHLAEFWMIEPEIAFADLNDVMDLAEDYVKYCIRYVVANNADDIDFFNQWVDKGLKDRLDNVTSN
jgi:asparaginyl-tRNA synthetase